MLHKPDLEPTFTEQAFRIVGYLTVVIGVAAFVGGLWLSNTMEADDPGSSPWIIAYGAYIGVVILLTAPWPFAIAEVLARLRRQEERELTREWEQDRLASEQAALADRERRRQRQAAAHPALPVEEQ